MIRCGPKQSVTCQLLFDTVSWKEQKKKKSIKVLRKRHSKIIYLGLFVGGNLQHVACGIFPVDESSGENFPLVCLPFCRDKPGPGDAIRYNVLLM